MFLFQSSDSDILMGIRAGGSMRPRFEKNFYDKYAYFIKEALKKHKIDAEYASMAYSDSVFTCIQNIATGKFEERSNLKTYLFQIFNNKCVDAIRKNTTNVLTQFSIDHVTEFIPDPQRSVVQALIQQQDHEKLKRLLNTLGDRCQELLNRWGEGFSDKESAAEFGYNTAQVAQTTRLRCLEKLKELYRK
jgi:RNA polymerase sigma factor (sigma-70 family)